MNNSSFCYLPDITNTCNGPGELIDPSPTPPPKLILTNEKISSIWPETTLSLSAITSVKLSEANVAMVKRCAYGICNSDDRYPERVKGVIFIPFPKPKTNLDRCLKWIKACNRPHEQLNVDKINKHTYVCSKHFHGGNGPTPEFPYPISETQKVRTPVRQPPKRRKLLLLSPTRQECNDLVELTATTSTLQDDIVQGTDPELDKQDTSCQTEGKWVDPSKVLELEAENQQQRHDLAAAALETINKKRTKSSCAVQTDKQSDKFDINQLKENEDQFRYYTGFSIRQFDAIRKFFVPDEEYPISLPSNRQKEIMLMSAENQLLMVIMKLRHDFDHMDLGYRFGVSKQTVSVLFTRWINYMFLRCGEVSIWPPRDIIFQHMPKGYQQEFPTTFAILDCTEIKICKPSSLSAQSQTFSDYKSTNTLKSLVACDPRGSIIYTSMLFAGSMSDKEIFKQSGCQTMLRELIKEGYLKEEDGLMADKGFNIHAEVEECGLKLNIPPFARSGTQMTKHDALHTKKIAAHRVHVERAIARIKRFEIIAKRVPLSLYTNINQIWYVCAFLSNFFNPCIQDKEM